MSRINGKTTHAHTRTHPHVFDWALRAASHKDLAVPVIVSLLRSKARIDRVRGPDGYIITYWY